MQVNRKTFMKMIYSVASSHGTLAITAFLQHLITTLQVEIVLNID